MTNLPSDDEPISAPADEEAPTEKVGYCNPPKEHQFKKGQQGNPKGRPKNSKNLKSDIKAVLNEAVSVKSSKGIKSVTSRRAIAMALRQRALQGDAKSALALFNMEVDLYPADAETDGEMPTSEEDLKIIETHFAWLNSLKKDKMS